MPGQEDSTHFLEHLLLGSTATRDTRDIAEVFDMIDGKFNATTSEEHTSYYVCVLAPNDIQALGVFADTVTSPLLEPDGVEIKRGVIVSELAGAADDPVGVVQETLAHVTFDGDTPLGRPTDGANEIVTTVPRGAVWEHYRRTYASNIPMVAAAGVVDHDEICERVLTDLAMAGWDVSPDTAPRERRFEVEPLAPLGVHDVIIPREGEQSHLYLICQGIAVCNERRWAISVLTTILGRSMSSRLFQKAREKRGLAYTTYAFDTSYADAGAFGPYAGCAPGDIDEVCAVMIGEFEKLTERGVTKREMMCARGQLRGAMILGGEDSPARIGRLGRAEVITGHLRSVEDNLHRSEAVALREVQEMAAWLVKQKRAHILVDLVD